MEPPGLPVLSRRGGAVGRLKGTCPFPMPVGLGAEGVRPLLALEARDLCESRAGIFRRDAAQRWHVAIGAMLHFLLQPAEIASAARHQRFPGVV